MVFTSEVQTDIMPGILQKLSDELHIDFEVAEFETTWPESIPWDDILRGSNISHVSYCLLSFFTSRITNSRYFFNSLPSNSIGSSSVCRHKMFFSSGIFVTAFCNSIFTSARPIWPNSFVPNSYLYID